MIEKAPEISFRPMRVEDVDRIMEIEHASFSTPWSRRAFINEITENRLARYFVVISNGVIAGYCGMWLIFDEAHITNIAIHPEFRGQKLGDALLAYVCRQAKEMGAERVTLEVRKSNTVAQKLYAKHGFLPYGIRKEYYTDNREDAIVMWKDSL